MTAVNSKAIEVEGKANYKKMFKAQVICSKCDTTLSEVTRV